ncbi:hypothetical protein [Rubripirellula lacrimiformis]|nr:hypothetical protein [Rubripirellula lacrimiformis]
MDKPLRPTQPGGDRPGISRPGGDRPSTGRPGISRPDGDRPGADRPAFSRPGNLRPDGDRPGMGRPDGGRPGGDRPGGNRPGNDRPINIGDVNLGNNTVINNRPTWANIDRNQIAGINNRWQGQINGMHDWGNRHPDRMDHWRDRGNHVRDHWDRHRHDYFNQNWWNHHHHHCGGWHYGHYFNRRPWGYWWTVPTYAALTGWFTWSAPPAVWAEPVYYDYGSGGNVTYENNVVYINGEEVAPADEFAQSAMDLATVEPPASDDEAEDSDWMALGTFSVSTNDKDLEPTRTIQLAVNKQGIISGTLYNSKTDQADTVQGQVDKDTQRVAFRIGDSQDVVVETGLYNLTQEQAPALVHFGTDKVEDWLLVRLDAPEDESSSADQSSATDEDAAL